MESLHLFLHAFICSFAQHCTRLFADFRCGDPFRSCSDLLPLMPQLELYLNTTSVLMAITFLSFVQPLLSPRAALHITPPLSVGISRGDPHLGIHLRTGGLFSKLQAYFSFNLSCLRNGFGDWVALVENFGITLHFISLLPQSVNSNTS